MISGSAPGRITGIRARLAGGGTAAGTIHPTPDGRVAVLVPPGDRAVTRVEMLGARNRVASRFAVRIPPATAQCGYGTFGLADEVFPG